MASRPCRWTSTAPTSPADCCCCAALAPNKRGPTMRDRATASTRWSSVSGRRYVTLTGVLDYPAQACPVYVSPRPVLTATCADPVLLPTHMGPTHIGTRHPRPPPFSPAPIHLLSMPGVVRRHDFRRDGAGRQPLPRQRHVPVPGRVREHPAHGRLQVRRVAVVEGRFCWGRMVAPRHVEPPTLALCCGRFTCLSRSTAARTQTGSRTMW